MSLYQDSVMVEADKKYKVSSTGAQVCVKLCGSVAKACILISQKTLAQHTHIYTSYTYARAHTHTYTHRYIYVYVYINICIYI